MGQQDKGACFQHLDQQVHLVFQALKPLGKFLTRRAIKSVSYKTPCSFSRALVPLGAVVLQRAVLGSQKPKGNGCGFFFSFWVFA